VTRKELCSWSRDPARFQVLFVAPVFAVLLCLLPLSWGEHRALAYVGPLCAQTAALVSANLYGLDGTALWSLLLTPRATRADVLGRQVAWLAVFGLMSLVLGAIATGFAPQDQAWPAMAALTTVMVLGAAGVIVALGTMLLVPGPDPRRRADSPLDRGNTAGPAILAFFLTIVLAAPTGGVLYLAAAWEQPELAWAATLVGLLSGAGVCWGGGRLAARHLERHGSEMLQLLRAGTSSATAASAGPGARRRRDEMLLTFGAAGGSVALFPQALMPAVFKLDGTSGRLWFLALYLPDGWQWPCIVAMAALGVSGYVLAARVYRRGSVLTGPARS
jgi:ABC-2 type transport system permease protein